MKNVYFFGVVFLIAGLVLIEIPSEKEVIRAITADAHALIEKSPNARLSLISVTKTLSDPLSYQVKLNTDNKDLLTRHGNNLKKTDILFNRIITEMWSKTYCRESTSKIIKDSRIKIFTASLNHNGNSHSFAICD